MLAVLYFYFDFNDNKKQRHEKIIRSLIFQLSLQPGSAPQALEALYMVEGMLNIEELTPTKS